MCRYGPLIVYDIENHRGFECACEIESVMIVALSAGSVSKPGNASLIKSFVGAGHGHANGLRELRSNRRGNGNESTFFPCIMHRHLPAFDVVFCVSNAVANHAHHVSSTNELSTWLSIGRKNPILVFKCHCLGYCNGLFSIRSHVE